MGKTDERNGRKRCDALNGQKETSYMNQTTGHDTNEKRTADDEKKANTSTIECIKTTTNEAISLTD